MKKTRILAYFDRDNGRDVELTLPVLYVAERYLNCSADFAFSYDTDAIRRIKPDLVFLPNTVGSNEYIAAARYASENGIPVFALMSEGDVRTDGTFNYWGLNHEKRFYQTYVCTWSERVRSFFRREMPEHAGKFVVTGHTGFDRYTAYRFRNKQEYLGEETVHRYQHVVGYAVWGFGKMAYPNGVDELLSYFRGDRTRLATIEPTRQKVEAQLRRAIEHHPDVLFVLKKHPNERPPTGTITGLNEITRLTDYPNVRIESEDAPITDIINVCDAWLSFESTTAIEAWALQKPTILLRPVPEFSETVSRKKLDRSQPVAGTPEALSVLLDELKQTGTFARFYEADMDAVRQEIIRDLVGFRDGLNHLRAGFYLKKTLNELPDGKKPKKIPLKPWFFTLYVLILLGRFFYIPWLYDKFQKTRKFRWVFEQYDLKNVHTTRERNYAFLDDFHQKHALAAKAADDAFLKTLIPDS